jgi:L-aspartate oxidase
VVYLDMTHLKEDHVHARFPRIYNTCMKYNLDITVDLIPVRPAAHYLMGGVRSDLEGRTSVPGLYAAGEAACTGVHGANRLASNSLLEGLVFGARAGHAMREELGKGAKAADSPSQPVAATNNDVEPLIREMQQTMWEKVGIVRTRQAMNDALKYLQSVTERLPAMDSRRHCEAHNLHTASLLIARSALARLESRGAHYRIDYPAHDDVKFKKHSVVTEKGVRFV